LILLDKLTNQPIEFNGALYATPSISAAMALVLPFLDAKKARFSEGHHPTAVVDPTAQIGRDVQLGPYAVIGAFAQVGDGCLIGSHAVVERGAVVGAGTILHPHVYIGAYCQLGKSCEIHPHATIGSDGFGFIQGPDQKRNKIPQVGIVIIEDLVEIGANTTVDRSTLGETRIGSGTKFDNLCHVAHNCKIGKNNVFAANFSIAGSSEIGDNCTFGGQAAIADHVIVGSSIMIGGRSGLTKDVTEPGVYAGFPLEPIKDAVRTLSSLPHLTSLRKQVAQIRKHLGMKEEEK
jgi:UDP-3-O-[3-hydroxymyristoyl] glucosamine N-acyltransferase